MIIGFRRNINSSQTVKRVFIDYPRLLRGVIILTLPGRPSSCLTVMHFHFPINVELRPLAAFFNSLAML